MPCYSITIRVIANNLVLHCDFRQHPIRFAVCFISKERIICHQLLPCRSSFKKCVEDKPHSKVAASAVFHVSVIAYRTLLEMAVEAHDAVGVHGGLPARSERDEVYWTELEVRRIGNMVAEMIQSKRYMGDTVEAGAERVMMRNRLDAMRRKALRVLCRAELHVTSGQTVWPGLDPSLTQPVNLAEEYIRTVTNYLDVLEEEEERAVRALKDDVDVGDMRAKEIAAAAATQAKSAASSARGDGRGDERDSSGIRSLEDIAAESGIDVDSTGEGDISYREALARASASGTDRDDRKDLLGAEGVRRRRGAVTGSEGEGASGPSTGDKNPLTGKYSKEDEELMARHQPVQDELTSDLVDLVARLKGNLTEINANIRKDSQVIDDADEAVDQNLAGIGKQRENLAGFARSTSFSWWTIWAMLICVVVVFIVVFALTKIPI